MNQHDQFLEKVAVATIAKETVEQIECDGVKPDLVKLGEKCRAAGHLGFAVVRTGSKQTPFVGFMVNHDGKLVDGTWASHATPEAALVALGG